MFWFLTVEFTKNRPNTDSSRVFICFIRIFIAVVLLDITTYCCVIIFADCLASVPLNVKLLLSTIGGDSRAVKNWLNGSTSLLWYVQFAFCSITACQLLSKLSVVTTLKFCKIMLRCNKLKKSLNPQGNLIPFSYSQSSNDSSCRNWHKNQLRRW